MEKPQNLKVRHTGDGEEIEFRPSSTARFRYTFTAVVRVAIVVGLLFWTYPALEAYFVSREITGPAKLLESAGLSGAWIRRVLIGWCIVLGWWGIGSLFEILKMLMQKDRFLLRNEGFNVRRTSILTRSFQFKSYDPVELRLGPSAGALEARLRGKTVVLSDGGTSGDREWLLNHLKERYRFPQVSDGTSTVESVATYTIEKRPDKSIVIQSSNASRMGCAVLAAAGCLVLVGLAVWLFQDGNGAGMIPLMFCAAIGYAALVAFNRRYIEASSGKMLVRWSSPAGKVLSRFASPESGLLKYQFGEGEIQRDSGVLSLKTVRRAKKNEPSYHLVLRQGVPEKFRIPFKELSEREEEKIERDFESRSSVEDEMIEEDLILEFTGTVSRPAAEYVLKLLSETTGFEAVRYF